MSQRMNEWMPCVGAAMWTVAWYTTICAVSAVIARLL
jgi:hypothetical protein